ncbi:hypothetical protein Patl1_16777 [Pistacia atlantica]|uniref:Uncharacterized protein n=1 Tax=Pistacia atlantica TaxID=434234 RepID=A0ACC1B789_9ROSI|nr:hypothetical protein Patl1_16777 [Pistacia atlantica]
MEETDDSNANKKCTTKTRSFRGTTNPHKHQYQHQLIQYSNHFGFWNQKPVQPKILPCSASFTFAYTFTPSSNSTSPSKP